MAERVVRMPSEQTMKLRLESILLPLRKEGVLLHFVRSVAAHEESAETIVSAWETACEEANKEFPLGIDLAITHLLHAYSFPSVVDAVIPDPEVAADAKEELRFLEEFRS